MAVISVLYVLIGLELRRSSSISNTNSSASHHHNSPHHLCNQATAAAAAAAATKQSAIQRNNNSIVLDNNSSPTTLIYNESKSVTFYPTNEGRNRTNSLSSIDQQTKLNNYLNTKDKEINKNLNSPSALKTIKQPPHQQFSNLKPSPIEKEELIELNNNQLNQQKPSTPLFLKNINNGQTTLTAHRPSDLMNSTHSTTLSTANLNTLNPSTINLVSTPTTQAVTISTGNSIHHHRHHQAAASRRSVIKMLGRLNFVVVFFLCLIFLTTS